MRIVYIAGPYSGEVAFNIMIARQAAEALWSKGIPCICPHLNSAHMEGSDVRDAITSYEVFLNGYLEILERCDIILMLPGWENSPGAVREHNLALELGIPIVYSLHQVESIIINYNKAKITAWQYVLSKQNPSEQS